MNSSHCPYCNRVLPALAAPPPAAEKLPCPRCGELVPASRWPIDPALATSMQAGEPAMQRAERPPETAAVNRKTGFVVLGIMISMAVLGLGYMLWTVQTRRARDPKKVEKFEPIAARRPLELTGLGYLPTATKLIAGLHVAEMLNDKQTGKALLAEPRPALLDWTLRQIGRTSGLKLDDLDHIIFATDLDLASLQLVMIVKTRAKVSLEKIAAARPRKSTIYQDQPVYEFPLDPPAQALVWCVDERTLIYVIRLDDTKLEHLRGLSATPRKIDEAVPAVLRKTMTERLPAHPFLWSVGQLDQLGKAKDLLPLALGAKADLSPLKEVQIFALGVEPLEGLTLQASFKLPNPASAVAFKSFLETAKIEGAKSQKAEVSPPDQPDQWVTWQVRSDVAAMRDLLNRGKK